MVDKGLEFFTAKEVDSQSNEFMRKCHTRPGRLPCQAGMILKPVYWDGSPIYFGVRTNASRGRCRISLRDWWTRKEKEKKRKVTRSGDLATPLSGSSIFMQVFFSFPAQRSETHSVQSNTQSGSPLSLSSAPEMRKLKSTVLNKSG